ncbi:MAG: hypothetical protein QXQ44_04855, partial [Candidatus Caldarchaeum sp.]
LQSGALYALMAIGLTLTLAILKIPNIAHAEYVTVGGYVSFYLINFAGFPLWQTVLPAFILGRKALEIAFLPIIIALLGGSGTLVGPLIGSIIFTLVYQLLLVNLPSLTKLIMGSVLIAVGIGASSGIVGLVRGLSRLRRKTYEASPPY